MKVLDWLLEADPSIRWQVLRDLTDAPTEEVLAERARVATEGWGARLLALQEEAGQWDGGTYFPSRVEDSEEGQPWTATTYSLLLLRDLGLDPGSEEARGAIALVRENSRWEEGDQPFFEGEVEPCINGMAVALGAYFGENVEGVVARLLSDQLGDGGWNCKTARGSKRSSFGTTISVLEGCWRTSARPPGRRSLSQLGVVGRSTCSSAGLTLSSQGHRPCGLPPTRGCRFWPLAAIGPCSRMPRLRFTTLWGSANCCG